MTDWGFMRPGLLPGLNQKESDEYRWNMLVLNLEHNPECRGLTAEQLLKKILAQEFARARVPASETSSKSEHCPYCQ